MTRISNKFSTSPVSNALYLNRQWDKETVRDGELSTISEEKGNESGSRRLARQNTFAVKVCKNWLATANTDILSPHKAAEVNNGSSLVKVPWRVTQHNSTWPSSSLTSEATRSNTNYKRIAHYCFLGWLSRLYGASEINLPGNNDFKGRFVGRSWHKATLRRGFARRGDPEGGQLAFRSRKNLH